MAIFDQAWLAQIPTGSRGVFEKFIASTQAAGKEAAAAQKVLQARLAKEKQEKQVALEAKYAVQSAAALANKFVAGKPGDAAYDEAILKGLGPKWKVLAQGRLATRAAQQAKSPTQIAADATYRRFDWETPGSALREKGWGEIGSLSAQTQGAAAARGLIGIDPTNNISLDALRQGALSKISIDAGRYEPGKASSFIDPESGYKLTPQQMLFLGGAGVPSKNDLFFQTELKAMGLTANSSDAQLAAGYDAVSRGQQYKNQLPKRGADFGGIGNIFFRKVLPIAAGFINPLLGAAVGAATGALAGRGRAAPIISGAATGFSGGNLLRTGVYQGPGAALQSLNPFTSPGTTPAAYGSAPSSAAGLRSIAVGTPLTAVTQVAPTAVVAGNALTRGLGAIGRGAGAVGSYAAANPYSTATTLDAGISAFNAPEPPTEEETTELLLTAFPSLQQNQQGVGSLANMAAGTTPTPNVPYTYEPSYTGKALGPSFMNQFELARLGIAAPSSGSVSLGPPFMNQMERGLSTSGIRSLDPNFMSQVELGLT